MTFKKAIGNLHLWLGLGSGLVVFVVSLTGAIFTFQDEIRDATQPWRLVATPAATAPLPPSRLQAAVVASHPGAAPSYTTYYGPGRSATVYFTDKAAGTYFSSLDPYTGRVLHEQDLRTDFFTIVQALHMHLLLPVAWGEWVVGIAITIFLMMLGTGLVLWWPKRRHERKQRLTIKWGAKWRRLNYDLHQVLGFYIAASAFIIALTGLFMSFGSWLQAASTVANMGQHYSLEETPPVVDTLATAPTTTQPPVDVAYAQVRQHSPTADMVVIVPAASRQQPLYCLTYQKALHYYHRDEYYFHPVSGQLLRALPHATKSNGKKLGDLNYDLHTGQLLGLGGKIVAFLISLLSASLPVTGTLLWWGRRHKQPQKRVAVAA
ncbi:PepSY-associated TM helix domain-containing protein [Hymenobacter sp. H14-R3]|uniref:PepSY-associated TM helix domain-containing protein n=1 Tax=Hymenobacter sp. H14-R3 TaxID=3046308 RepID=UPI0024BBD230|nr:PepSY-associated TM helix domain-containing protein [Hymenobacter sp. H14-R3]MDJ0364986.1 PepSY-associated TM helix domain-containing protein [Hymenobacter sp. H14-R3]